MFLWHSSRRMEIVRIRAEVTEIVHFKPVEGSGNTAQR